MNLAGGGGASALTVPVQESRRSSCNVVINTTCEIFFSKSFPSKPNVTIEDVDPFVPNVEAGNFFYTYSFLANTAGVTWLNMPSSQTEIFGNTNDEILVPTLAGSAEGTSGVQFWLNVNCAKGSLGISAELYVQWATVSATPNWQNLSSTNMVVPIDSASCQPPPATFNLQNGASPDISASAKASCGTTCALRIVGRFGNGVGDNPIFTNIDLEVLKFGISGLLNFFTFKPTVVAVIVGRTNFNITILTNVGILNNPLRFYWSACMC